MKKPFAYVTAVWQGGEFTVIDQATVYCRKVYEAGFTPLCPVLYLPHFLRDSVPAEHIPNLISSKNAMLLQKISKWFSKIRMKLSLRKRFGTRFSG